MRVNLEFKELKNFLQKVIKKLRISDLIPKQIHFIPTKNKFPPTNNISPSSDNFLPRTEYAVEVITNKEKKGKNERFLRVNLEFKGV